MPPGTVIAGRYEVLQTLGQGAFGRTFLARDRETAKPVAIKMLDSRRAEDWKAYELFEREASVLRQLRHHGLPEVYQTLKEPWEGAEAALLVMEYIEGTSLARLIEEHRHLSPTDVGTLLLELLGILDYLHSRVPPILHRDIKPANIIVRPNGFPALVDFGAVRSVFKSMGESGSTVVGTYGYMPYEQYMGQATPSSDLYALGATFLHLLTGRPPPDFISDKGQIEVPSALPGDERLRAVITRLLRPSPADRFQSARDVRQALLSSVAMVAVGEKPLPAQRTVSAPPDLPPVPRRIEGATKALYERVRLHAWDLANGSVRSNDEFSLGSLVATVFFSVLTAGILPIVFITGASERNRRLRPFFKLGLPATAEVLEIHLEDFAFGEKIARVRYQFEADGTTHRDADGVLPYVANRWRVGDQIQVLYIPERDYDSVIISK